MSHSDREALFNRWADNYDLDVLTSSAKFPFDGYDRVLDTLVSLANVQAGDRVLDLGVGTGNLAARFLSAGCQVWGVDFSAEMLVQTRLKYPQIIGYQADLLAEWPQALMVPFDRVVSAYVFHEFDLNTRMELLRRVVSSNLAINGKILIADISFPSTALRAKAAQAWAEGWDDDEFYWAADEAALACEPEGWILAYEQVSSCAGIYTLTPSQAV